MAMHAAKVAHSIEDLATVIDAPVEILRATLADLATARSNSGPDGLGRDWSEDAPPAPPYRALRVRGVYYHTQGGLQVDGEARVLRSDGAALPNLFAGGGARQAVTRSATRTAPGAF